MMMRAWRFYQRVLEKYPFRSAACTTGLLMGVGDVLAQVGVEKHGIQSDKKYDVIRTVRFVGFGVVGAGPLMALWYRSLAKFIGGSKLANLKMVACDQLLFAPPFLAYFLAGICALRGEGPKQIKQKLEDDYADVMFTNWKIWPFVQTFNFTFIPVQHRILIVNVVAVGWNTYLAWKAEHTKEPDLSPTSLEGVPS